MATVLVVDDRPTNIEIARETLGLGGHRVVEAAHGRDALIVAKRSRPDVVVTDVMMPGMDGFQLVHELRSDPATAGIPVLLYTAHYSPAEASTVAATVGVSSVLSKAGDPLELLDAVDAALRDHPPHRPSLTSPEPDFGERHLYTVNAKLMQKIQALDESDARFAAMAEESPIGIVIGDPAGLATYVNPRLSDITRMTAADLVGQGWLCCLHAAHRDALYTSPDGGLDPDMSDLRFRERLLRTDGHTRWLSVLIRAMHDSEGHLTGFIAMIDDITDVVEADERRQAEEREREAETRRQMTARFDSLARLSGGVAHDFNNILNVILSYDEFAKDAVVEATGTLLSEADAQAIVGDLDKVHSAGERAARITHKLLAFGGREVVLPAVVDVNALIGDAVRRAVDGTAGRVSFGTDLEPALRPVRIDPGQLSEVLTNLIVNADEAMPAGGRLRLESHNFAKTAGGPVNGLPTGDYVHIAVTDDGEGMPAEVVQHAMEPFFTTRSHGQSSGLGLATAYGITKQAGGELLIESEPGRGTTVHLYLPATDAAEPPAGRPAADPAAVGQTVLVVDDEDGLRAIVGRILTKAGYQVITAGGGQQALALAAAHSGTIDALVTDVVMPITNGRELANALQAARPGLPVLFMSGYAAPLMTEQGLLDPGVTVLGKPFTQEDLLSALRTMLTVARR